MKNRDKVIYFLTIIVLIILLGVETNFFTVWSIKWKELGTNILIAIIVGLIFTILFDKIIQEETLKQYDSLFKKKFNYFEEKYLARDEFILIDDFNKDLNNSIKERHFNEVKLMALTGQYYYQFIKESNMSIDNFELLIRKPNRDSALYPENENDKNIFAGKFENFVSDFQSLYKKGKIKKLHIKEFNFDNLCHFMVSDKRLAHFGLLKPVDEMPGSDVLKSLIIYNKSATSNQMIEEFSKEFDQVFHNYSETVYNSKDNKGE